MIWKNTFTTQTANDFSARSMVAHLGIEFTEIGPDFIVARMPVDHRTHQPYGLLHGGASVALAETLGSFAAHACLEDPSKEQAVGLEINANHLRPVTNGWVYGTAKPIRLGRKIQVWSIEIKDDRDRLICVSRLTIAIITAVN